MDIFLADVISVLVVFSVRLSSSGDPVQRGGFPVNKKVWLSSQTAIPTKNNYEKQKRI